MKRAIIFGSKYIFAAVSCVYLLTLGWIFGRNRVLIGAICAHFGYVKRRTPAIIPTVAMAHLVSESTCIQIREPVEVDGNATVLEMAAIAKLIRLHDPRRLFEIGTFDGRTTLNMAANCSAEAKVYTLDLPASQLASAALPLIAGDRRYIDKPTSGSRYMGTDCEPKIVQLYGDSATFDFSPYYNEVDFVFIDGSHSYDYVISDTERALRLLRNRRGIILWHDYGSWEGVTKALNQLYSSGDGFRDLQHVEGTTLVCLIAT